MNHQQPILEASHLTVDYMTQTGPSRVIHGVSIAVAPGETLALVGESGSGKSTTAMAIAGLLPDSAQVRGEIKLRGTNLLSKRKRELEDIRGKTISVIFQNPMTSLNPTMRVGKQIVEQIRRHMGVDKQTAHKRALELLEAVQIRNVEVTAGKFPHELSGGMRQRVMIAMAISCDPDILIADEPTTALDVTVQKQILNILRNLRKELGMTVILVTHDMGVVAEMADNIAVMYDGRLVEYADTETLFKRPQHPYTKGLLLAQPRIDDPEARTRVLPTISRPAPTLHMLPSHLTEVQDAVPGTSPDDHFILVNEDFVKISEGVKS